PGRLRLVLYRAPAGKAGDAPLGSREVDADPVDPVHLERPAFIACRRLRRQGPQSAHAAQRYGGIVAHPVAFRHVGRFLPDVVPKRSTPVNTMLQETVLLSGNGCLSSTPMLYSARHIGRNSLMQEQKIYGRREGAVGHLVFNNPAKRNAVSLDMWDAFVGLL